MSDVKAATGARELALDGVGHVALRQIDAALNAPDGIAGVRALVLDLAMRGRLLDDAAQFAPDEGQGPFPIPERWRWANLGSLCEFINGDRSKNYPSKQHQVSTGVPFINAGHLKDGRVDLEEMNFITEERFALLRSGKVQDSDVLYCLRGSLGKCAVVRRISKGAIASSLLILRPLADLLPEFLYRCLTSPLGDRQVRKYDNGTAQPNLSAADVRKFLIPLPPLAEQKRIVAKVDQLMALCDELEAKQAKKRDVGDRLRKAALAALTSAETPEEFKAAWIRVSENFDHLADKRDHVSAVRASVLDLAVSGQFVVQGAARLAQDSGAFAIPAHWRWVRGTEVFSFVTSGSRGWAQYYSAEGPIFLRIGNLDYESIELDLSEIQRVRPPAGAEGTRTKVEAGDVLISITGDTGMVGLVREALGAAYINQHIALVRPVSTALPEYIARALTAPMILGAVQRAQRGIKNSLGLEDIRSIVLPLPPLDEQKRIVGMVGQLMTLCDELEKKLVAREHAAARLAEALGAAAGSA